MLSDWKAATHVVYGGIEPSMTERAKRVRSCVVLQVSTHISWKSAFSLPRTSGRPPTQLTRCLKGSDPKQDVNYEAFLCSGGAIVLSVVLE